VIEAGAQPVGRQMAITAFEIRGDVVCRLAGSLRAVVADDAEPGNAERDLRVIHCLGQIPAHHRMAGFACLTGGRVGRSFALGDRSVVTTDAGTQHFGVIEMHLGTERIRVVAGRAIIRALDMRRRFRRCIEGRARDVAHAAVSRRPLEDCVQVTGFAR